MKIKLSGDNNFPVAIVHNSLDYILSIDDAEKLMMNLGRTINLAKGNPLCKNMTREYSYPKDGKGCSILKVASKIISCTKFK